MQISAVQLTTNNISDSVYTDRVYDTKHCRKVISNRQAYTAILPEKNANPWEDSKTHLLERSELLRKVKHFGKTKRKNWSGYHRRSMIETKMHRIKLFDDKVSA